MRKITEIILHCSATAEGLDFSVRDIRAWHKAQGWADVGYHYVVRLDGTVQEGRPLEQAGAHCKGHNDRSIGICYIGGLAADGLAANAKGFEALAKLREATENDNV